MEVNGNLHAPAASSLQWTDFCEIGYGGTFFFKIYPQFLNLVIIGQKYPAFNMQKYAVLLPATSNRHKNAFFGWNGVTLIGQLRKFKNYANALYC